MHNAQILCFWQGKAIGFFVNYLQIGHNIILYISSEGWIKLPTS